MKYAKDYFTNTSVKGKNEYSIYINKLNLLNIPLENKLICDVGCATGEFLENVIKYNTCYGIDISAYAINQCYKKFGRTKNKFFCLDLNYNEFNEDIKFDVITMFDVIEHLNNFINLKRLIHKNLKKGGHVIVTTPNSNSLLRYISQNNFTGETDKTHVILFTPYTLDFFLRKSGLSRIYLSTPYGFYFKNNFITENLLFGGQIFAIYEKI